VILLLAGGTPQRAPDVTLSRRQGLALVERLRRDLAGMIDTHEPGCDLSIAVDQVRASPLVGGTGTARLRMPARARAQRGIGCHHQPVEHREPPARRPGAICGMRLHDRYLSYAALGHFSAAVPLQFFTLEGGRGGLPALEAARTLPA